MAINEFKLKNLSNSKEISFHWGKSVRDNITVNNISINKPGASADNNFSANFGGFKRLISVDFALYNDGTDKSSDGSSIITLSQQIDFIQETILQGVGGSDSIQDVSFQITVYRDATAKTYTGVIESLDLNADPEQAGTIIFGSLTLQQAAQN